MKRYPDSFNTKLMLFITIGILGFFLLAGIAHAGILQVIKDIGGAAAGGTMGIIYGAIALVLAYALKKIPNELIQKAVGGFAHGLGVTITLGLTKWK